jgi:hypothetical protein
MTTATEKYIPGVPFAVAEQRFYQKNEMVKRSLWDEKMQSHGIRFYREAKFREKAGFRRLDYALRNAAWNLGWGFAMGNSRRNSGLDAWEGANQKIRHYIEAAIPIENTPPESSRSQSPFNLD